ncbi:hypothetical protein NDA16_001419 [Ustilago loliicola]|nr:hypothetical protein NDA16_001419 [Ustilago loliicola]
MSGAMGMLGGSGGGLPGIGLGPIPTFGQIQQIVNQGIAAHRDVQAARQNAGAGAGAGGPTGAAISGAGGPGAGGLAGAGAAGQAGTGAAASPLARRATSSDNIPPEISALISAALKTNAELHSTFDYSSPPPKTGLERRTPLGPMMMMGGMGGAGMGQMIQAFIPAIMGGIDALGKVGVAFLNYKKETDVEKMKEDFARNMTESGHPGVTTGVDSSAGASTGGDATSGKVSNTYDSNGNWKLPDLDGPGAASSTTGSTGSASSAGSAGLAGSAGSTGLSGSSGSSGSSDSSDSAGSAGSADSAGLAGSAGPAGPAGSAGSAGSAGLATSAGSTTSSTPVGSAKVKRDTSSTQCGGNAQLCYQVIEQSFPYCVPSTTFTSDSTKYRKSSANLVRLLAMHCSLKCTGFSNLAEQPDFKQKAETCTEDRWLFNKIHSIASTKHNFTTRAGSRSYVRRDGE